MLLSFEDRGKSVFCRKPSVGPSGRVRPGKVAVGKLPASDSAIKSRGRVDVRAPETTARDECVVETDDVPNAKPAEFFASGDEGEFEEPEELKKVNVGRSPTAKQRQEHEEENHAVYREWCEVRVAARGTGAKNRRQQKKGQVDQEERGPMIVQDFYFMSTIDGSVPTLASKFSRSGRMTTTVLPSKGVTEFVVKLFA